MTDLMSAAGAFTPIILGITGLGALLVLAFAGVAAIKRRVPVIAFAFVPFLLLLAGSFGVWSGSGVALLELSTVAPADVAPGAFGHYDAILGIDYAARWFAAFLLAAGCWAAALGSAIGAGPEARWTPVAAIFAALISLGGAAGLAGYAGYLGLTGDPTLLAAVLGFGGLGVAVGATRRAILRDATRVAAMRFASVVCLVLAVSYAGSAMTIGIEISSLGPDGVPSQGKDLLSILNIYAESTGPVFVLRWVALALAVLVALPGVFWELGEVVDRVTVFDLWGLTAGILVLTGVTTLRDQGADAVLAVATTRPAVELYAEMGPDLMPALLSVNKTVIEVDPQTGGFGDVLTYSAETGWQRVYAYSVLGWTKEETPTPLDRLTFDENRPPLLAVESGTEALPVARLLEKIPFRKAMLLMRAAEVKAETVVPPELAYLQVTFLTLELADAHDLKTEVWHEAGSRRVMWGPTWWFGPEEQEEPVRFLDAVYTATASPGLQILVNDRSRVKDIVNSCLPTVLKAEGDKAVASGRFCKINPAADGFDSKVDRSLWNVWRDEAASVWELPAPELVALKAEANKSVEPLFAGEEYEGSDVMDAAKAVDRLYRELGGIDYCLGKLRDEGETIEGDMQVTVSISMKKGKVSSALHEKSKLTDSTIFRCIDSRFGDIQFEVPTRPEPTEEEKKAEEERKKRGGKEEEPPLIETMFTFTMPKAAE